MTAEAEADVFASYEWAIVRLATCMPASATSNPLLLAFASLEFVHTGRPQPDSTPLGKKDVPPHIEGMSGLRVYFRRVGMKSSEALSWYREAAEGKLTIPVPADPAERGSFDGRPLSGPPVVEEPRWPRLAFPVPDQALFGGVLRAYPTPFLGPGAAPARIHRLMASADPYLDSLADDLRACDWLAPRLHFRIEEYPELLGSLVLVAPDPQVEKISQYFVRDAEKSERLVTQVQARPGQRLDRLRLTILEERFGAISTFRQLDVPPYQIWDILTGWSDLGLDRKFGAWSEMFRHARPSFEEDGSWTKRTLEPLLLEIAENALKQARLPKDASEGLVQERGNEYDSLTKEIGRIISQKPGGAPLALRWAGQLFRASAHGTDEQPYPRDLRNETTPLWRMLEALGRSDAGSTWNDIAVPDAAPEEVLSLLAAKTVAADERRSKFPDMKPLLDCCPDGPEEFLGVHAIGKRMETMPFLSQNTRPDALRFRVFGLLFFQGNPVDLYRDLWRRAQASFREVRNNLGNCSKSFMTAYAKYKLSRFSINHFGRSSLRTFSCVA
jgi:hypothetical protein